VSRFYAAFYARSDSRAPAVRACIKLCAHARARRRITPFKPRADPLSIRASRRSDDLNTGATVSARSARLSEFGNRPVRLGNTLSSRDGRLLRDDANSARNDVRARNSNSETMAARSVSFFPIRSRVCTRDLVGCEITEIADDQKDFFGLAARNDI